MVRGVVVVVVVVDRALRREHFQLFVLEKVAGRCEQDRKWVLFFQEKPDDEESGYEKTDPRTALDISVKLDQLSQQFTRRYDCGVLFCK